MAGLSPSNMSYSPAEMKSIILEALSPCQPASLPSTPQANNSRDTIWSESEITSLLNRTPTIDPPSSLPALPSYTPTPTRHINHPTPSPLVKQLATTRATPPISSPLRTMVSADELSSSPYTPPARTTNPSYDSPIRPLSEDDRSGNKDMAVPKTYEVDSSFLQAMIGLLERQANIVPEHLFTKEDVEGIVRREVARHTQSIPPPTTPLLPMCVSTEEAEGAAGKQMDGEGYGLKKRGMWSESPVMNLNGVNWMLGGVAAMCSGAFAGVMRRVWMERRAEVGRYGGEGWKGAVWGLGSVGVVWGVERWRRR